MTEQDFYKLKNADKLAIQDIGEHRFNQYVLVCEQLEKSDNLKLKLWASIFLKITNGLPATHFIIDLNTKTLKNLN